MGFLEFSEFGQQIFSWDQNKDPNSKIRKKISFTSNLEVITWRNKLEIAEVITQEVKRTDAELQIEIRKIVSIFRSRLIRWTAISNSCFRNIPGVNPQIKLLINCIMCHIGVYYTGKINCISFRISTIYLTRVILRGDISMINCISFRISTIYLTRVILRGDISMIRRSLQTSHHCATCLLKTREYYTQLLNFSQCCSP